MRKGSSIKFRNYDQDKMIVDKNGDSHVENLINQSFNSVFVDNYRSSRLGESMIKNSGVDLMNRSNRSSYIDKEKKGNISSQNLAFPKKNTNENNKVSKELGNMQIPQIVIRE
jgi:hypothetical protein